ncbi:MAG: AFG1/ZapE family ATPase, partial [Halioglobus sp.]|nr:AFG1/ZapE family ATPase [Halioglobus sp.]
MTTPWQRYQIDLQHEDFTHDPSQEEAVRHLQDLYERLVAAGPRATGRGLGGWLRRLRSEPLEPERGLYLWGGVGRG